MSNEVPTEDNTYAAMSDEEFLNHAAVIEAAASSPAPEATVVPEQESDIPVESSVPTEPSQQPEETTEPTAGTETPSETSGEAAVVPVNFEDFYNTLTTPFKANGRDFQVTNPQDMITLMQKGADYVKKMTEIKPLRRIGKLLEDNQLNEADLSYLIDLKNKKPEAIAKLLKDSEVDLLEFDLNQAEQYVPNSQPMVSDEALTLQATLDDLKTTSNNFEQMIAVVGNQWDEASKAVIAQHPQLLRIIDTQIANGTFAKIDQILQYERALGRLDGMSDIEAYTEIERRLQNNPTAPKPIVQVAQSVIPPTPTAEQLQQQAQQQKLAEQRKQAAPPRQTQTDTQVPVNPNAMSDDDFLKFMASNGIF